MIYLDVAQFETYVAGVAARAGVSVRWDDANATPRTDGKIIYIPRINAATPESTLVQLRYFIKHEVSHIAYTNFKFFADRKVKGLLQFICNLLEDNRIDYHNDSEWHGDVRLSNAFAECYSARIAGMEGEANEQLKTIAPLFAWEATARGWIPAWELVLQQVEEKGLSSNPVGCKRLDILNRGDYLDRLVALRTSPTGGTHDLLALAKSILEDVYGEDAEKYMEEPQSGTGKGESEGMGESSESGSSGEDDGEGEGEVATVGDAVDRIITVEKLESLTGEHLISRTGIHLEQSEVEKYTGWVMPASSDYKVVRKFSGATGYFDTPGVKQNIDNNARPLAAKLRTKLQVRSKGHYEYGTRTGKLHAGSLHRLVSGRGTEAESRVFRKHVQSNTLDTAVSLLVDCSGSMSGTKYETAAAAAASVALALKPLHIAYNVLGFTTDFYGTQQPIINVFQEWGENVTQDELVRRMAVASRSLMDNADGDCIAWAANHLLPRKEKRKILIVLSDGAPAGRGWAGSCRAYTEKVIKEIESRKLMEIYGIGIMDANVRLYYSKHAVINKVDDLPGVLLSTLDRAL